MSTIVATTRAQQRADAIKAARADRRAREHAAAYPDRNVDYVFDVPVPYAPLTRCGLRALHLDAINGLEQLEALHALRTRTHARPQQP